MKKLAKIYGLEVRDEPGSVIVEDDGMKVKRLDGKKHGKH